ncbi:MAG TPA: hypothetical protein DFS52_04725 [Myxococcales bacterium]|nr:hypothetical protein [Myxococcales bacterium]
MAPASTQFPLWAWIAFGAVALVLLFADLFGHRKGQADTRKSAILWSAVWIGSGLAFYGFIWIAFGYAPAQDYLGAYLIEKSLSLDNIFVFLVIFESLQIPQRDQRTVLYLGILGAVVFRAIFIFLGAAALERWHFVVYVFAAILLWAAWRVFRENPAEKKENKLVTFLSRHLPVTTQVHGRKFFAKENGKRVATPLLVAIVALELTDITFAVDSVPAALAITTNRFLVYTSNIFAILGLRALYVVLATTICELEYLHYGLAVVLAFAAAKLAISSWVEIPALLSVAVIVVVIGGSALASVRRRNRRKCEQGQ